MLEHIKKHRYKILCIAPLLIFLLIFTFLPIAQVIILSFQPAAKTDSVTPPGSGDNFTLAHYQDLFFQKDFRQAFFNTVFIAFLSLALELSLGLSFALLLCKNSKIIRFLRPLFILPLAIPTTVVGVMMSYLFTASGWLNRIFLNLRIIDSPIYWMSGGVKSLLMIALADCWKVTPLVMLILLAGIQSIDTSLYKAARIDGAGSFYIFKRITLPLLLPSITAAVIIRGIDAFRIFALPLILMGQNLKVIGTFAYLEYSEFNNPYVSAASAVLLLIMILSAVLFYIKVVGKKGIVPA
ncbi:MAG: sugar ABC transporter permease [Candidatus Omnitrophota bacterium]|nr:MAG: sugar ABC transporter permease [Candidatus Omnitrophota bacterium]